VTRPTATAVPLHPVLAARWSTRAYDPEAELSDAALLALLEAARWAPSRSNSQPARFLVGRRGDATFTALLDALKPRNRQWAQHAAALLAGLAPLRDDGGEPATHASYDLGQAVAHLSVQATALGLSVRQMSGFSADVLRQAFAVPDDHEAYVVVAVGRHGDPVTLAEEVRAKEAAPRARRLLAETVFASAWGSPLPAARPRQRDASPPSG
jgi:nitroreductase